MTLAKECCRAGLRAAACISCAFGCATSALGQAQPDVGGNALDAAVAAQYTFDNNLYRLPPQLDAAFIGPNATREDHIASVSAGGDAQWSLGLQQFVGNVKFTNNRFVRNTDLNNTSGLAKAQWNWIASPIFLGDVGADYSRSLANYANEVFAGRDLLQNFGYFGDLRLQFANHWRLLGGLRNADLTHSLELRRNDDFRSKSGNAGIQYFTSDDNYIGLEYRYTNYRFSQPISLSGAPFDADCNDSTGTVNAKYVLTGKTSIDATFGYLKRHYLHEDFGSFAGNIWHAKLAWQVSGKTHIDFAGWRDLTANLESQSDYFVSRGGSVSPTWNATERISLAVVASWSSQDYLGASPSAIEFFSRRDKVVTQQAVLQYIPRDALALTLTYQHEYRDSNLPSLSYNDRIASANVQVSF